jgi:signal transduction histidine kinase/ligand-binding sensor domain-containing protein
LGEGRDGRIFAGGPEGLFCFENGELRRYGPKTEGEVVNQIRETMDGALWVVTNHGLRIFQSERTEMRRPGLFSSIYQDRAANIWLGTVGDGLRLVRDGRETTFRAPAALPDNSVSSILEDREENIWVGTDDGLVRMTSPNVGLLNSETGIDDENVGTVYSDHRGAIWISTTTGRVYRYFQGQIEAIRMPEIIPGLRVRTVFEDHTGAFWFGTSSHGVLRSAHGSTARFTTAEGLRNNGIQAFAEDRDNHLWIGTTSGISVWDGTHFKNYYIEDGLSYGWVRAIVQDRNGDMLVGTDRGINRFHDGRFVTNPAFSQLSRDRVWSIYPDSRNSLWVGTRGDGLVRIQGGKVSRITTKDGLLSNAIFNVAGDGRGRLWMSGPQGISSASLADLDSLADGQSNSVSVLSYESGGGLVSTQMNGGVQPSGCLAPDGELWFPSVRGAIHFSIENSTPIPHSPARVESVIVDEQPVPHTSEVVIGPMRRRVTIEFTACNLRNPERESLRYKLEGFDGQWRMATGRRNATYDNLPPGHYNFRVIASDMGGSSEAGFSLLARPHFYQTVWFYALGLVFVVLGSAGVLALQERQARDRYNLRLAERTRIAREMHDTVVQGCIGVSTLIEAAVGSAGSDQDLMMECLDNARIHLRMTLDEARQALSDLRHDSFDNGLAGALSELAQSVSRDKDIPVTFESEGADVYLPEIANRSLLLVAREAIRNAVGHGAPTIVSVRLSSGSTGIRLDIQDNGCGFDPASAGLASDGHFGILGMRERMEQIGGSLEVESSPDHGTRITAHSPFANTATS